MHPVGGGQLFIASTTPHKPVKPCTIAGWLRSIMAKAGVDVAIWSAHSTRGASTSKAFAQGVPITTILETACWKRVGTFRRFYNRKPISEKSKFEKAVLSQLCGTWL